MQTEIIHGPAYAAAKLTLARGETVRAEAGSMLAMSAGISMQTSTQGGVMKGLRRSLLGGESFFMNTFHADVDGAELWLAPALAGDIVTLPIGGDLFVQSGSFLGSADGVDVDSSWGGSKTFFSREGLFILKVSGHGDAIVSSYGAIHTMDLQPGQT